MKGVFSIKLKCALKTWSEKRGTPQSRLKPRRNTDVLKQHASHAASVAFSRLQPPSAASSRQPLPLPRLPPPPPHRRRWPTAGRRRRAVRKRPTLRVASRRRRGVRERPALRGPAGTGLGIRACAARCASHRPLSVEASPKRRSAAPDSQPQSPPSPQPLPSAEASPERCTTDSASQPQSPPSPRAIPPRVR